MEAVERRETRRFLGVPLPGWPEGDSADPVHRLRDLSPTGKGVALVLAVLLVLPPLVAFFQFIPVWRPTGDNAYIALRSLDVGTSRNPLLGQPSTSSAYSGDDLDVRHLGPWHFYLLAPFVRAFGAASGMLVVSVLVASFSALLSVWAVFRRFGPAAGVGATAALGVVYFAIGNGALINPISSNFAGLPMLCGAVLVWAVIAGDDRLLPVTTVVLSFAIQMHLSVGPAVAVLVLAGLGGVAGLWWRAGWRQDRSTRRRALGLGLVSAGLGLVMWLPVLIQQVFGADGNLAALFRYVGDSGEGNLGFASAVRQVTNVLAYPPLLLNTQLSGLDLLAEPDATARISAIVVLVVLIDAGYRWWRAGDRRVTLVVMLGVLLAAGVINGANVPRGMEEGRLAFYHWIWPFSFFLLLALASVVVDAVRWLAAAGREALGSWPLRRGTLAVLAVALSAGLVNDAWIWQLRLLVLAVLAYVAAETARRVIETDQEARVALGARRGAVALTVCVLVVLVAVNPGLDRPTNTLHRTSTPYPRDVYDGLTDQVLEQRDALGSGNLLVLSRGEGFFDGSGQGLALSLYEAGLNIVCPSGQEHFVDDEHIVWDETDVDAVVLLAVNGPGTISRRVEHPGSLVASYDVWEDFDEEAFLTLSDQVREADHIEAGPSLAGATVDDQLPEEERAAFEALAESSGQDVVQIAASAGYDLADDDWAVQRDTLPERLEENPDAVLTDREDLNLLLADPLASPQFETGVLQRMRESVDARLAVEEADGYSMQAVTMEVYLITEPEELDDVLRWQAAGFDS